MCITDELLQLLLSWIAAQLTYQILNTNEFDWDTALAQQIHTLYYVPPKKCKVCIHCVAAEAHSIPELPNIWHAGRMLPAEGL